MSMYMPMRVSDPKLRVTNSTPSVSDPTPRVSDPKLRVTNSTPICLAIQENTCDIIVLGMCLWIPPVMPVDMRTPLTVQHPHQAPQPLLVGWFKRGSNFFIEYLG